MTVFGGYRTVWLIVMFDLPTDTPEARAHYRDFRNQLLDDGFDMMQFSVYLRHCESEENAAIHKRRVQAVLPPDGEVRLVTITDKQFGRIETYFGKIRGLTEAPPEQVSLF